MRTIRYKTMFERFCSSIGRDAQEFTPGGTDAERFSNSISRAVRTAWEFDFWPDIMAVRELELDEDNRAELIPGEAIEGAYPTQKDAQLRTNRLMYLIGGGRIEFWSPVTAWIVYRPAFPVFTTREWDAEETYAEGDACYLESTGECYRALGPTTGDDPDEAESEAWEIQRFPEFMEIYVQSFAEAENSRFLRLWEQATNSAKEAKDELFRMRVVLMGASR